MRLCTPVSLFLAAAALLPAAPPAHAAPDPVRKADPTCAAQDDRRFPLTTRIHGGPDTYEAGGGYGIWYLDLTNTTTRTCGNIHPVVVLVDDKHELRPSQPHLEFYEGTRPHPVRFETTDEDELVGAFDDGFPGFSVGAGKTVSVKVRLALTSDTAPNGVTADAAVVQRRGDDGDWVGQSNDYAFRIQNDTSATPTPAPTTTGTGSTPPSRSPRLPFADELARTGLVTPGGALAATAVLCVTGGAVLLARRRR
ncbi:hypothetical protein [Streptomyces sp. NPDC001401]|uniref:hypothetical protein n=1 Tax=Streptomyces sp. NPDC001401 TaxID=3364570 RepID=UPI0036739C23